MSEEPELNRLHATWAWWILKLGIKNRKWKKS